MKVMEKEMVTMSMGELVKMDGRIRDYDTKDEYMKLLVAEEMAA